MVSDSERFNKTMQEAAKYRVQCECGKASAIFYPFEHKTKKLCRACGNYIYSDEKKI